jgi:hypothetical protein
MKILSVSKIWSEYRARLLLFQGKRGVQNITTCGVGAEAQSELTSGRTAGWTGVFFLLDYYSPFTAADEKIALSMG